MGKRSDSGKVTPVGKVLFVPLSVGTGRNPVIGDSGLRVAFLEGRGRRPEAVVFRIGKGEWPDTDALKLVVKFTVGSGKRPDLGKVEFAVELVVGIGNSLDLGRLEFAVMFTVGEGKNPDIGKIEYAVKLEFGIRRLDICRVGFAVALTLGKMPAETEKIEIVLMFKVGKA